MLSSIGKKLKNISHYLLLFLFHLLLITPALAQADVKFRHLSFEDGLSQNAVFDILQDSNGFMWFGTKDGLNRYHGYSFTVFNNIPFNTTSISDGFITELFKDSRRLIWVGTMSGSISVYQHESGEFKRINFRLFSGENTFEVTSFTEDADSNIWFGIKMNGLFRLNIHDSKSLSFSYKQFLYDPDPDFSFSSNQVNSVFKDSSGTIWAGTANGLNRFNNQKENFYNYPVITKNNLPPSDLMENGVTDIYQM